MTLLKQLPSLGRIFEQPFGFPESPEEAIRLRDWEHHTAPQPIPAHVFYSLRIGKTVFQNWPQSYADADAPNIFRSLD